jgi:hypothetical protein
MPEAKGIAECWREYSREDVCPCTTCQSIALAAFTAGFLAFWWHLDVVTRRDQCDAAAVDIGEFMQVQYRDYEGLCAEYRNMQSVAPPRHH